MLDKTLESPLDCKEIQPVHPKEISPEYSLEGLIVKLKLQYLGHLMRRTDLFEKVYNLYFYSFLCHFSSVTQPCLTLCDPMDCSTPGLPVHHQLPESTQTHVHRVSDAIQPSHPLLSPSPPAFNLSQHQGLFK